VTHRESGNSCPSCELFANLKEMLPDFKEHFGFHRGKRSDHGRKTYFFDKVNFVQNKKTAR